MVKITKMGDINYNIKLECYFCKELILPGMPFFSVTFPVDWNPPQDKTACKKCAKDHGEEAPRADANDREKG